MNTTPSRFVRQKFVPFLLTLLFAGALTASAGTVSGVVTNGTTNTTAGGVDVILLQLQGGMQAVATTKADAQGRFSFDRPEIGTQPMLIRVQYRGVNYHQPVPPGATTADVQIFDNSQNPGMLQFSVRAIVLQPRETTLLVGEEFTIVNQAHPPVAYYRDDGTFLFSIPQGATIHQVSAWGSTGMPVEQGTIDKAKGQMAIAFPLRPGENGVRMSYEMLYPDNKTTFRTSSPYAFGRVLLVAPPTVQVISPGFVPAGTEQGWAIYSRDSVPANTPIEVSVSGTAPAPSAASAGGQTGAGGGDQSQNPSVNSRADTAEQESTRSIPGRLDDNLKWILVGGFAALFVLGVVYLWRQPQEKPDLHPSPPPVKKPAKVQPAPNSASSASAESVNRAVQGSLDELKDNLFRLELRRQAGTISEDEYAQQRSRAEQVLRELVKG
jgi:hypothetical protein